MTSDPPIVSHRPSSQAVLVTTREPTSVLRPSTRGGITDQPSTQEHYPSGVSGETSETVVSATGHTPASPLPRRLLTSTADGATPVSVEGDRVSSGAHRKALDGSDRQRARIWVADYGDITSTTRTPTLPSSRGCVATTVVFPIRNKTTTTATPRALRKIAHAPDTITVAT